MFGSEQNMGVSLGTVVIIALLVGIVAGCVPLTDPDGTVDPSPLSLATVTAALQLAAPVAEVSTEIAVEQPSTTESVVDALAPSPLTHGLARHEECVECHEVETGRGSMPADHRDLTEAVCLFCHMPEEGETAVPPLPAEAETDFCLGCHGPFEVLAARTAGTVIVEEIEGNPHMYVPHASTRIFSCDLCHGVHPLPVNSEDAIPQADVQYCFLACHHTDDFRPCEKCHDDE